MPDARPVATVDGALRLETGIGPDERSRIVASWGQLDSRLRSFDDGAVELILSVKERETASQRAVLEARIHGFQTLVATSTQPDLNVALDELRDDMLRQITDAKTRSEPRNNRSLREST